MCICVLCLCQCTCLSVCALFVLDMWSKLCNVVVVVVGHAVCAHVQLTMNFSDLSEIVSLYIYTIRGDQWQVSCTAVIDVWHMWHCVMHDVVSLTELVVCRPRQL